MLAFWSMCHQFPACISERQRSGSVTKWYTGFRVWICWEERWGTHETIHVNTASMHRALQPPIMPCWHSALTSEPQLTVWIRWNGHCCCWEIWRRGWAWTGLKREKMNQCVKLSVKETFPSFFQIVFTQSHLRWMTVCWQWRPACRTGLPDRTD